MVFYRRSAAHTAFILDMTTIIVTVPIQVVQLKWVMDATLSRMTRNRYGFGQGQAQIHQDAGHYEPCTTFPTISKKKSNKIGEK